MYYICDIIVCKDGNMAFTGNNIRGKQNGQEKTDHKNTSLRFRNFGDITTIAKGYDKGYRGDSDNDGENQKRNHGYVLGICIGQHGD